MPNMFQVKIQLNDRTRATSVVTVQANGAAQAKALVQAQYGSAARILHVLKV
jgi:hypothetical protein